MSDETFTYPREAIDKRNAEFADLEARAEKAEERLAYYRGLSVYEALDKRCAEVTQLKARAEAAEKERDASYQALRGACYRGETPHCVICSAWINDNHDFKCPGKVLNK